MTVFHRPLVPDRVTAGYPDYWTLATTQGFPIAATPTSGPLTSSPGGRGAVAALRRQLGQVGVLAVSIGVMAPTLAMSITGIQAARLLGRAAPVAYALATVGVALVAYGFVRLSGEFASAGSVYAFVGRSIGPRAGFVCGWALLGTYLVFPAVSISAVAIFARAFLVAPASRTTLPGCRSPCWGG